MCTLPFVTCRAGRGRTVLAVEMMRSGASAIHYDDVCPLCLPGGRELAPWMARHRGGNGVENTTLRKTVHNGSSMSCVKQTMGAPPFFPLQRRMSRRDYVAGKRMPRCAAHTSERSGGESCVSRQAAGRERERERSTVRNRNGTIPCIAEK